MLGLERCLVTGSAGFIGSHLVGELVEAGAKVRALVRYTSRSDRGWLAELKPEVAAQVEVVFGDVNDADQMRDLVAGCSHVFHLAALIGIPYSYVSPRQNLETNTTGTLNVLAAAREADVRRVVHVSTSEVYGTAQYVPIDEGHPVVGQSPYSASKIAAEAVVTSFVRSFEVPAVIVRPFNTFGPRQSLRAVIPTLIAQALHSDRILLGSLHTTRDFTFVSDTARGLMQAGTAEAVDGETLNLGVGEEISVGDLAQLVLRLVERDVPIEHDEARMRPGASEVERLLSDPARARASIGWDPQISLEEGLRLTIEWLRGRDVLRVHEFAR